jgi:hypothetical protein
MSTVHEIVKTTTTGALSNSWAVELPPDPEFPAAVYTIDTEQEDAWCIGGGYDQHLVTVVLLYRDFEAMDSMKATMRAAFEAIGDAFMFEEAGGDAEYEDDPEVFAYAMAFRLRTPRYA